MRLSDERWPDVENWSGPERRSGGRPDTGARRRHADLREAFTIIESQDDDIQNLHQLVNGLMEAVARLDGKVTVLMGICGGIDSKADKLSSVKTFITFAATVMVPIIVALIGGYFFLRAGLPATTR